MQESLYDRFRPFKPYDLALALVILVLVAVHVNAPVLQRLMLVALGIGAFFLLELAQRFVRVPTPPWQSTIIVCINTFLVTALDFLEEATRFTLAFYMLNIAFATVAFGRRSGVLTAVLSVASLALLDALIGDRRFAFTEYALFLALLLTLVAILMRINRLQQDALIDAVTGLRNHRYFQGRLREELERSDRMGRSTALIMIDLDNFKGVNDRFGHAVGDYVLSQVSRVLEQNARTVDAVCRYGGEELAVILPETSLHEANLVAERLREAVERRNDQPGPAVTVSCGVAAYPEAAEHSDALIAAADASMYSAKRAGKNRVICAPCLGASEPANPKSA
ncbi:MAG: GGDEF domain-containing protein [Gemmataceae bacterium]|nr:GGDEF domain-containing protein [Gemmataceae bacterium]